jgi:hypothetical protein
MMMSKWEFDIKMNAILPFFFKSTFFTLLYRVVGGSSLDIHMLVTQSLCLVLFDKYTCIYKKKRGIDIETSLKKAMTIIVA